MQITYVNKQDQILTKSRPEVKSVSVNLNPDISPVRVNSGSIMN
jgi:hypothetical protein